ncbi:unannotated protein [freshwater metagenome]|uniref:Unannotated protein n=1 Tax=freshwater metagenome TaxID=449393 RepID=A0A6J6FC99_9ZZZZ
MNFSKFEVGTHLRCSINTRQISSLVITIERFLRELFKSLQRCSFTSFDYFNTCWHWEIWKGSVLIWWNRRAYFLWSLCRSTPTMYTPRTIERCVDAIRGVITWLTDSTGCNRVWTSGANEFYSSSFNAGIAGCTVTFVFI